MNAVEVLKELGFRVEEAVTAVEALNKVRLADGRIDAALIDVGLPDRRGDSLAAELRAMYSQMPIVIASGYGQEALGERFSADPSVSFLGKPYETPRPAAVLRPAGTRPPAAREGCRACYSGAFKESRCEERG